MTLSKQDLRELTDQALDAFWETIVKRYPQARTGDLSPWPTMKLQMAAEDAVAEWIDNNVPAVKKNKGDTVMTHIQIQPGYRFRLRHDIDRFPDFVVREGTTGTVTEVTEDGDVVALMDRHIHGAEQWDNHVWWDSDFLDDTLPLNS